MVGGGAEGGRGLVETEIRVHDTQGFAICIVFHPDAIKVYTLLANKITDLRPKVISHTLLYSHVHPYVSSLFLIIR